MKTFTIDNDNNITAFPTPDHAEAAVGTGDLVEGAPFRFHPHVGIARKHRARDVARDAHDHFVARARLREFCYQGVARVMPAALTPGRSKPSGLEPPLLTYWRAVN